MNIFSKGPGKTEFIMKFVQAIMSQRRLVNFLMYCTCNCGAVKHTVCFLVAVDRPPWLILFHNSVVWAEADLVIGDIGSHHQISIEDNNDNNNEILRRGAVEACPGCQMC